MELDTSFAKNEDIAVFTLSGPYTDDGSGIFIQNLLVWDEPISESLFEYSNHH